MYSDSDLDAAVAAGAITADAARSLREYVAAGRATPIVDEEHFRLISGFNDIFVSIAGALLLMAVGWIGGEIAPALGAAAAAAVAWGLAEYFTRRRRMALPSILLLLAFVGGVFGAAAAALLGDAPFDNSDTFTALMLALSAAIAAGAAWLHWRRFHVPITVAAGAAALVTVLFGLLISVAPEIEHYWTPVMFAAGLGVFAGAMWWDISDRERQTRRSDVAFWLHLLAAPLIVHPAFTALGVLDNSATIVNAVIVVGLYVLLALLALAIDRRALMVSALVIGSALLLLSAFWHTARLWVVGLLPAAWQDRLPAAQARQMAAA